MKRSKKRRLSPGAQFRSPGENLRPKKPRVLAADRRRIEREQAEEKFPVLAEKLAAIRSGLLGNLAKGRYGYRDSLLEVYELAWKWAREDKFEKRVNAVAKLSGRLHRKGANPFNALIAAVTERDNRTVSRWSQQLNEAFERDVVPKKLLEHIAQNVRSGDD
ncbi:MAG: hypothetical protein J0G36_05015 [Afipia sp.]|nr:hypothetical protein [Afipia sp.]